MAVFYRRDERAFAVVKENLNPGKILKPQNQNHRRVPLVCISNGNGGLKRSRDASSDDCVFNAVALQRKDENFEHCLKLVTKENISSRQKFKIQNEDSEDTVLLQEYGKDIWTYLYSQEARYSWPKSDYMLKQKQLTYDMRSILIDWFVVVAQEFKIQEQTIYLSVNYIDRFLGIMSVVREKFQLLGAAAMMLAIKVEEVNILDAEEWSELTGKAFNSRQIIRMEQLLLNVLKFDLNPPTVINFVELICANFKLDNQTLYLAMFLLELTLLEGSFFLDHLPSKLAVSSIVLARYLLRKKNPYFLRLETTSGYHFEQLKPLLITQHRAFEDSPKKELKAIQNKYKSDKYHGVANIAPLPLTFEH